MNFTKLDFLYLRRLVSGHIDSLERRRSKYQRFSAGGYQSVDFQEKIALVETELKSMQDILRQLDEEISMLSLQS